MTGKPRKLDCDEAISLLFEFLDNELAQHDHDAVEAHLHNCRACFSRMEFDKRLRAMVKGPETPEAPESLHERIKDLLGRF